MNTASHVIRIVEQQGKPGLTKAQKLFNNLIQKIDLERKLLADWQATIPRYQQKYVSDFGPLIRACNKLKMDLVRLFDKAYAEKTFGKRDKVLLQDIICSVAESLMGENDEEELKQIYKKYCGIDVDAEAAKEKDTIKAAMAEMFGIDLDDDGDLNSPEELKARFNEKMRQQFEQEEQMRKAQQEKQGQRKKSAKVLAKEAKQQEELQNISQSIREVFRKLASALHPDKEQDVVEQARKTILMQRVNVAYGNKDLLQLLELQLEVDQIDQGMLNIVSEERLKYYNKVLTGQLAELRQEVSTVRLSFGMQFNMPPWDVSSPIVAMRSLQTAIKNTKQDVSALKKDLVLLQEPKNLKYWLKSHSVPSRPSFEEEMFGEMDMEAFFESR